MNTKPNSRYSLTKKQQAILTLLYRFRFATSEQISQAISIGKATINKRLQLMTELEYIGRHYEPEYHLLRKHASYYLLPQGMAALKQIPSKSFDPSVLHNIHKDKTASDQFIEYCLGIFGVYCRFKKVYGDSLRFFTKSQLVNKYDYFSEFVPSVYIRLEVNGTEKDFFLEYLQSSKPFFTIVRRLKQYIDYADSGEWEDGTGGDFPYVLLVCDNPSLQKRLIKRAGRTLEDAPDELLVYATTESALRNDGAIWTSLAEPEEEHSLDDM